MYFSKYNKHLRYI